MILHSNSRYALPNDRVLSPLQVVFWIDEHDDEEESEMIISDIKLGLRDLLVRTRKYPDTDDHDLFRCVLDL